MISGVKHEQDLLDLIIKPNLMAEKKTEIN